MKTCFTVIPGQSFGFCCPKQPLHYFISIVVAKRSIFVNFLSTLHFSGIA